MGIRAIAAWAGAAAVTAAAAGFTAAPALASGISVEPSSAARGTSVTVVGGCDKASDSFATLSSPALVNGSGSVGQNGGFTIQTTVKAQAKIGRSYPVTTTCNVSGIQSQGTIFVKSGSSAHPSRWPHTGGGGMAAAADDSSALGGVTVIAGLSLLAGALTIGGVSLLRARRGRG